MNFLLASNFSHFFNDISILIKISFNFKGIITTSKILKDIFFIKKKNIIFMKIDNLLFLNNKYVNSYFFFEIISFYKIGIIFLFDFGIIIKSHFLKLTNILFLNIHASLLPKYRGSSPIYYHLLSGNRYSGISIFKISSIIDNGLIFDQLVISVNFKETYLSFKYKICKIAILFVIRLINNIYFLDKYFIIQNNIGISYTKKVKKIDGVLNQYLNAFQLECKFRAFFNWPYLYFYENNKRIIIKLLIFYERKKDNFITKKKISILTQIGILDILRIKFKSKFISNIDYFNQNKNLRG